MTNQEYIQRIDKVITTVNKSISNKMDDEILSPKTGEKRSLGLEQAKQRLASAIFRLEAAKGILAMVSEKGK